MIHPTDIWTFVPIVLAVFLLAGVIKGTLGIGLPTVSVGIMSLFLPPHTAIAIVVLPIVVSNLWQVIRERAGFQTFRRYWLLMVTLVLSLWLTTFFVVRTSPEILLGAIGIAIVTFAATSLFGKTPELPDRMDKPAQFVAGTSAGVLGGLTSIWAPPIVTYMLARRTPPSEFVKAVGLFLFVGSIPLLIGFWQAGMLSGPIAGISALMVVPTVIGFTMGEFLRRKMSAETFRTVLLWMFLLMGLNLLRRAVFG